MVAHLPLVPGRRHLHATQSGFRGQEIDAKNDINSAGLNSRCRQLTLEKRVDFFMKSPASSVERRLIHSDFSTFLHIS